MSRRQIAQRGWSQNTALFTINAFLETKTSTKGSLYIEELIYISLEKKVSGKYDKETRVTLKANASSLFMLAIALKELLKRSHSEYKHVGNHNNVVKKMTLKYKDHYFINIGTDEGEFFGAGFDKYEMVALYTQVEIMGRHVAHEVFKAQALLGGE
jgi:hypothetical protein